jgi:glycosyltransferase involved in cell wall biosynthesis
MKRKKVLLVYPAWSVFVQTDFEILSEEFDVYLYHFKPAKGIAAVLREIIKQFGFLIFNIWRFRAILIWFADQHSLLPVIFSKLLGKRSLLVVGGYDVCRIPNLNYGVFCSVPRGLAAAWSLKNATVNLPVSTHVARKVRAITRKNNSQLVFNCVKETRITKQSNTERKYILTVALIDSERTYLIKGIDMFVETARLMPRLTFMIVGFDNLKLPWLVKSFPQNIELVSPTEHKELPYYYQISKVYCQLSRSESFGIALAEAILHGCIPLVTNEGGMPEVVGDKRYVVSRNPVEIASKINEMVSADDKTCSFASHRIKNLFSRDQRALALKKLLQV